MTGLVLAIDPGASGAFALLGRDGTLVDVVDTPALDDSTRGRKAINAALAYQLVQSWAPSIAYCEFVSARPTDGAASAFSFGRNRGTIEGVVAACGVPLRLITPQIWKRHIGLPPGEAKDLARSEAIRRWPAMAEKFSRKLDHDRAEACLIGVVGIEKFGGRP